MQDAVHATPVFLVTRLQPSFPASRSLRAPLRHWIANRKYARQDSNLQPSFPASRSLRASLRHWIANRKYARQDSNLQPSVPKTDALSN